ncbi:MAG: NAD(P)-binding domain-containing protein [Xanthobacteraceae bacterium]|jgi:thioredoxin reductase
MVKVENAIVGAGPYGLSIAAHFRAAGIESLVIGQPMASWRNNMPEGMILKSEPFASNLSDPQRRYTLERFYASRGGAYRPIGNPLSIADFLDYARWFQQQTRIEAVEATLIDLRQVDDGFELALADGGVITARCVVLATGYLPFKRMPSVLDGLPSELISHSSEHRDLAQFAGKDVTIVGCGQSALELAVLLHEQEVNVRVLARADRVAWGKAPNLSRSVLRRLCYPDAGIGPGWRSVIVSELPNGFRRLPRQFRHDYVARSWGPAGAWWLEQRARDRFPLLSSHAIAHAVERGGKLALAVQSPGKTVTFETDHVIAATGYRVDLDRIQYLSPGLRAKIRTYEGAPILDRALQSSIAGLHFVGVTSAQSFGPVMRFVYGAKHAAALLTAHLRKDVPRPSVAADAAGNAVLRTDPRSIYR